MKTSPDNAELIALATALKHCSVPMWITLHAANVGHLSLPRPDWGKWGERTDEQWLAVKRREHNRAVVRVAHYVAAIRRVLAGGAP